MYDTRPEAEIAAEEALLPPAAIAVHDPELPEVIAQAQSDRAMLIVARRRYWRYLNDDFRDVYREHKETNAAGPAPYRPTSLQRENMQHLMLMLEDKSSPDWLEVAELHRELGEPDKALECLGQDAPLGNIPIG